MSKKNLFTYICVLILLLINLICIFTYNFFENKEDYKKEDYNLFSLNKIIIIGDSRMSLIMDSKDKLKIPNNYIFIAANGTKINWLKKTAINKAYNILKNSDDRYKYNVVFNLGVNDLNDNINIYERAHEYYFNYKNLILYFKNVDFYFLSVNPIDDKINDYWENIRTNEKIEEFNNYIKKFIKKDKLKNTHYCDSYNELKFKTYDGLHYTRETNIDIVNYIDIYCINTFEK